MKSSSAQIPSKIAQYYDDKLAVHGCSHLGADWNSEQSQQLRFQQLLKVVPEGRNNFSICDLGCGYGAILNSLDLKFADFIYEGVDISKSMINAAREMHGRRKGISFFAGLKPTKMYDYLIASGIMNVKIDESDMSWKEHLYDVIGVMNDYSSRGFAFNCLSIYSDVEKRRPHLYYADPLELFDFCKKKYSANVALLHDYSLYEFTMVIRKEP